MHHRVILAYNAARYEPTIFRSYDHSDGSTLSKVAPRSPGPADETPLWKIARATSSRPNYFSPIKIDNVNYEDGGFAYRNPSQEIIHEVLHLNNADRDSIDCLVSIGCGIPQSRSESNGVSSQSARKSPLRSSRSKQERQEQLAAYDSDSTHEMAFNLMISLKKAYWRLDLDTDLWNVPLDDFVFKPGQDFARNEKLDREVYAKLASASMERKLHNCARRLVGKRHGRSKQ